MMKNTTGTTKHVVNMMTRTEFKNISCNRIYF